MDLKDLFIAAAIVTVGMVLWFALHRDTAPRFRRRPVLTGGELEFFFRLQEALPECAVCPQVALMALVDPLGVGPARQSALARIEGQRVGYAVFDREMELVAVVELDQKSRPRRSAIARDRWLAAAGVRTVRFQVRKPPSLGRIRATVFARGEARAEMPSTTHGAAIDFSAARTPWRNTANFNL